MDPHSLQFLDRAHDWLVAKGWIYCQNYNTYISQVGTQHVLFDAVFKQFNLDIGQTAVALPFAKEVASHG